MNELFPEVTVGLPVFNGERFIRQAIDSVLAQSFNDFELLISDNASTDGTSTICAGYAAQDNRIKFVRHATNRGAYSNFQFVTNHARGGLLVWLAHDDELGNEFLEVCSSHMRRKSSAVLVCGDFKVIDDSGSQVSAEVLVGIRENICWRKRCGEFYRYPISNAFYCIYGMMRTEVCKSILRELKEPKYMAQIELPILARFAAVGEIFSIPFMLRSYRRHNASLYHSEMNLHSQKSRLNRVISQHLHVARLRIDQMRVLLFSSLKPRIKGGVILDILRFYALCVIANMRRGFRA